MELHGCYDYRDYVHDTIFDVFTVLESGAQLLEF